MSYGQDYNYRAYEPDVTASPRRGNAPIVGRPEDRRVASDQGPSGYPPYDSSRLSLLDDHGDTVRVGLSPASSTPNLGYNTSPYPSDPYYGNAQPIAPSPYGNHPAPAPSYGAPQPPYPSSQIPYGGNQPLSAYATHTPPPAHHLASSSASYSTSAAPFAGATQRRPQSTYDDPLAFGSSDRARPTTGHRTPSSSGENTPEHSPVRSTRALPGAPPSQPSMADFIPASFTAGNAVQAASSIASFFSTPAPTADHPPTATGGFPNMSDVYSYLGNAASKVPATAPTAGHPQGTMNIAGVSIDKDWVMNFISNTNPLVLLGAAVVAFLVISQIIGMIIKFAIMGAVVYGIVLYVMAQNKGGAGVPAVTGSAGKKPVKGRKEVSGGWR